MSAKSFIDGSWVDGNGASFETIRPYDGVVDAVVHEASAEQVLEAVGIANKHLSQWRNLDADERRNILRRFGSIAKERADRVAELISTETGKPLWEAKTEAAALPAKVDISIDAMAERAPEFKALGEGKVLRHKPIGVMAVIGPFNFPAHLPNGHIVPALLAGNAVVYKPSEYTPRTAQMHVEMLVEAGVPPQCLQLLQGARATGEALVGAPIDGLAFTGSVPTGIALHKALAGRPEVLLALELGGNTPLLYSDADDLDGAVNIIIRSAFITAGQRCTCARKLLVPANAEGDQLIERLIEWTSDLRMGAPFDDPAPFLGPVISETMASRLNDELDALVENGAELLTARSEPTFGFFTPTIIEDPGGALKDEELFGPLLTIQRYEDFDQALTLANDTKYGLAAGLISADSKKFNHFVATIDAGIVNWNTPTTGAASTLPFGGVGLSGNHRPAAWYAADYCAYPVASLLSEELVPGEAPQGVSI